MLDRLFNSTLEGVALVSRDGRFLAVNDEFCRLVGYSRVELINGMTFQDITFGNDVFADERGSEMVANGQQAIHRMMKTYRHKMKHKVPVVLDVRGLFDESNSFICFVSQVRPLVLSEASYKIYEENGEAKARVSVSLGDFIKDNWNVIRWFIVACAGLGTFVGAMAYKIFFQ